MIRRTEDWITVKRASEIMTTNSGHDISEAYIRRLGASGKIGFIQIDGRTKLYSREDVSKYVVRPRGDGSVRRIARAPRGKKQAA
jgi:hypothetical protein